MDSAVSALLTRKRLEFGYENNFDRGKRSYERNSDWWKDQLRNSRSNKRKQILTEIAEADKKSDSSVKFDQMTEQELRLFLKNHGINTKNRNREKLMGLISSLSF